jgi:very-short-patch-repair endonuclease
MKKKIDQDDDLFVVDLLLESDLSLPAIAKEVDLSIKDLNKKITQLGLTWIKEQRKKSSRGQSALTSVMKKLLPNEKIINEHHLGDKLRLDVYCPSYKLAAEFHGRQHFYYTERFFDSKYEFEEAQKRDIKKVEMCKEQGIALIVFRYNDLLTEESVYSRMIEAIRSSEWKNVESNPAKKPLSQNIFYQQQKKKNSEHKKQVYRAMKQRKKNQ